MEKRNIIAICGPSCSGKDTLAQQLNKSCLKNQIPTHMVVPCTTRPARVGEQQDREYHFITPEDFYDKANNGDFLEYNGFRGWHYGTLRQDIVKNHEIVNIGIFNPKGMNKILYTAADANHDNLLIVNLKANTKTRLFRSINREHKIKFEYFRRALTDFWDMRKFQNTLKNSRHKYHIITADTSGNCLENDTLVQQITDWCKDMIKLS